MIASRQYQVTLFIAQDVHCVTCRQLMLFSQYNLVSLIPMLVLHIMAFRHYQKIREVQAWFRILNPQW